MYMYKICDNCLARGKGERTTERYDGPEEQLRFSVVIFELLRRRNHDSFEGVEEQVVNKFEGCIA